MKITQIVESSSRTGLYRIAVDKKPLGFVSAEDIFSLNLIAGRELNSSEYRQLLSAVQFSTFLSLALRYADRRLRSKKEVITYLQRKGCDRQTGSSIADKLESIGVIDESKLAAAYIHDSKITKPMSQRLLRQKLMQKKISPEVVEEKLEAAKLNDQDALEALVERKLHLSAYKDNKNRLIRYLLSQGFSYEDIVSRLGRPEIKKRPRVR